MTYCYGTFKRLLLSNINTILNVEDSQSVTFDASVGVELHSEWLVWLNGLHDRDLDDVRVDALASVIARQLNGSRCNVDRLSALVRLERGSLLRRAHRRVLTRNLLDVAVDLKFLDQSRASSLVRGDCDGDGWFVRLVRRPAVVAGEVLWGALGGWVEDDTVFGVDGWVGDDL